MKVPVSTPDITDDDILSVAKCMKEGWISGISPWVDDFEKAYAAFNDRKYAVATGSGTTSLHLAAATLHIGEGDEVIMPTFTMIASANAVRYLGAKPVFVDSDINSWCMDEEQIKEKINHKTAAIMPVHIYGHMCDMRAITEIAYDRGINVIEDAAEAHGAEQDGMGKAGSIGDIGAFSLYANKIITTGEGGILTMDLKRDYERARWLRAHAFGRHGRHYWHEEVGYGYRMSGLQAALGLSQLERIDQYIEHRIAMADLYLENLYPALKSKIETPIEYDGFKNVFWMFSVLCREGVDRDDLITDLAKAGIETRTFFYPLHEQPPYKTNESFPVAEDISRRGLSLPSGNQLTEEQVLYVCEKMKEILGDD